MKLTKKQKQIYDAILEFIKREKFPPTVEELTLTLGLKSKSTTHFHLVNMREKGFIEWWEGCPRTFRILKEAE